jgi:6-pyruvoyltetrahydropterin/6-carboxytetrahydropterin synthase|tara:strand:+ start:927 stop:1283 length:357 start_codon:yes stop_codon:yes gene_type:complete
MMDIYYKVSIDCAHFLPNVPEGHKCRRLHGHTYRMAIWCSGEVNPTTGFVIDYYEIEKAFEPIYEDLDHRYLNEVPGLENPTVENLAVYIFERMSSSVPVSRITIDETCTAGCSYDGS